VEANDASYRAVMALHRAPTPHHLTGQQRKVAEFLVAGLGYKRIAARMGIAERTVKMHVKRAAEGLPGEGSPRTKLLLWAPILLAA
jgi:DNA-binding NarL/FixJ family response regulator